MKKRSVSSDVLRTYQRISPSRLEVEDPTIFAKVEDRLKAILFHRLKFPPAFFDGRSVVDFGCGTGEKDVVLGSWGARCFGLDFNSVSIERALGLRDRFGLQDSVRFEVRDILDPAIPKAEYDFTISFGVLPHVDDPMLMLSHMADATRPGGFLILGFLDIAGNMQRLLHGIIVRKLAEGGDAAAVARKAYALFKEHIDRCVEFGGRSPAAVINDYICNQHSYGHDSLAIVDHLESRGLSLHTSYPLVPRLVNDAPSDQVEIPGSRLDRTYARMQQLGWMLVAHENEFKLTPAASDRLGRAFEELEDVALRGTAADPADALRETFARLLDDFDRGTHDLVERLRAASTELFGLIDDLRRGKLAATEEVVPSRLIFRGFNGFGTCYLAFHKP